MFRSNPQPDTSPHKAVDLPDLSPLQRKAHRRLAELADALDTVEQHPMRQLLGVGKVADVQKRIDNILAACLPYRAALGDVAAGSTVADAASNHKLNVHTVYAWMSGNIPPALAYQLPELRTRNHVDIPRSESEAFAYILGAISALQSAGRSLQPLSAFSSTRPGRFTTFIESAQRLFPEAFSVEDPAPHGKGIRVVLSSIELASHINFANVGNSAVPWSHIVTTAEMASFARALLDLGSSISVSTSGCVQLGRTGGRSLILDWAHLFDQLGATPSVLLSSPRPSLYFRELDALRTLRDVIGFSDPAIELEVSALIDRRSAVRQPPLPLNHSERIRVARIGMPNPTVIGFCCRELGLSTTVSRQIGARYGCKDLPLVGTLFADSGQSNSTALDRLQRAVQHADTLLSHALSGDSLAIRNCRERLHYLACTWTKTPYAPWQAEKVFSQLKEGGLQISFGALRENLCLRLAPPCNRLYADFLKDEGACESTSILDTPKPQVKRR